MDSEEDQGSPGTQEEELSAELEEGTPQREGLEAEEEEGEMEEGEEEEGIDFDNSEQFAMLPPLDPMRKSRREILFVINEIRMENKLNPVHEDFLANYAATSYADYLLTNEPDTAKEKEFAEQTLLGGEYKVLVGYAILEEDMEKDPTSLFNMFLDAHGLLMELSDERNVVMGAKLNHVGIGFSWDEKQVKVVEYYSTKAVSLNSLATAEDGTLEVQCKMLDTEYGLYAIRIAPTQNLKKDTFMVGPPQIELDKDNLEFVSRLKIEDVLYSENIGEIYIRKKWEKIGYGKPSEERINIAHLELCLRFPMELIPDPRAMLENAIDDEKKQFEEEQLKMREEEQDRMEQATKAARREVHRQQLDELLRDKGEQSVNITEGSIMSKDAHTTQRSIMSGQGENRSSIEASRSQMSIGGDEDKEEGGLDEKEEEGEEGGPQGEDEDEDMTDEELEDQMGDWQSDKEMKEKLIETIQMKEEEYAQEKKKNLDVQRQIALIHQKENKAFTQQTMNEHRYLNTLANVNQVRMRLKQTQDSYNSMAADLQNKLNDRQQRCNELKNWFKEFKREISKNAEYNRTGHKISKKLIKEWEDMEATKDQEVHQYRLLNISLRFRLNKAEKKLKKKEQLADDLHLIDFEQLKIENQTLNEKIEERNEELHKLRKKIHTAVIILTHIREKEQQVRNQNIQQAKIKEGLATELKQKVEKINELKNSLNKDRKTNIKLKKDIGYVHPASGGAGGAKKQRKGKRGKEPEEEEPIDLEEEHEKMKRLKPELERKIFELRNYSEQLHMIIRQAEVIKNQQKDQYV